MININAKIRGLVAVSTLILGLTGCASMLNQRNARDYYNAAVGAELAGNYALAERNYGRALVNTRLGSLPDSDVSATMYGLGRMEGRLCKYAFAEQHLAESLALEEKIGGPESFNTIQRLFELTRFYVDRGQYDKAVPLFQRAIPAVRKIGIETSDPIGFANTLDDYAVTLEKTGDKTQAAAIRKDSMALRAVNPGRKARFIPVRYNQPCPDEGV